MYRKTSKHGFNLHLVYIIHFLSRRFFKNLTFRNKLLPYHQYSKKINVLNH